MSGWNSNRTYTTLFRSRECPVVNKHNSNEQTDAVEPQRPRNAKRKAEETDANTGTGSGANGEYIKTKTRIPNGNKHWTDPTKFGWPKTTKDSPFNVLGISWDSSWPADKKAYYNARKKAREKGNAWQAANDNAQKTGNKALVVKKEATKAQKIAALKKQLKDLEE